eukprot:2720630-Prymnesium_polylepis.3
MKLVDQLRFEVQPTTKLALLDEREERFRARQPVETVLNVDNTFPGPAYLSVEAVVKELEDAHGILHALPLPQKVQQRLSAANQHQVAVSRCLASVHERHVVCSFSKHVPHALPKVVLLSLRKDRRVGILQRAPEVRSKRVVELDRPAVHHRDRPVLAREHKIVVGRSVQMCLSCGHRHALSGCVRAQCTMAKHGIPLLVDKRTYQHFTGPALMPFKPVFAPQPAQFVVALFP